MNNIVKQANLRNYSIIEQTNEKIHLILDANEMQSSSKNSGQDNETNDIWLCGDIYDISNAVQFFYERAIFRRSLFSCQPCTRSQPPHLASSNEVHVSLHHVNRVTHIS